MSRSGSDEKSRAVSPELTSAAAPATERVMAVVLPFENLGPAEDEYFAAGMTNEINSRLATVAGLGVISRKSAESYAAEEVTMRQIGEELGADYVLDGSVQWARGDEGASRVRITPQLIRVADDSQVWTEVYDREMDDVFSLQSEIAEQVVRSIDSSLIAAGGLEAVERPTENLQAYDNYLQAKNYFDTLNESDEDRESAMSFAEKAVAQDPKFAEAHSLISQIHSAMYFFGDDPTDGRILLAKRSAETAMELDGDSPEAHTAMGLYHYRSTRDYDKAMEHFQAALEVSPSDASLYNWISTMYKRQGQYDEALRYAAKAQELDPRAVMTYLDQFTNHSSLGRHQQALDALDAALRIEPDNLLVAFNRAALLNAWKGDIAPMRDLVTDLPQEESMVDFWLYYLFHDRKFDELIALASEHPVDAVASPANYIERNRLVAQSHLLMGNRDAAVEMARVLLPVAEKLGAENPRYLYQLSHTLSILGRAEAARTATDEWSVAVADDIPAAENYYYGLAVIYSNLGDVALAASSIDDYLETQKFIPAMYFRVDPNFDLIRDTPEFQAILAKHSS